MAKFVYSSEHPDDVEGRIQWPNKSAKSVSYSVAGKTFEGLDERTAHMLEIIMTEDFKSARSSNHVRIKLALWVVRNKLRAQLKRVFDFIFALVSILVLSPVLLLTAVAVKLDSPGPVFYKQLRVGKRGKKFFCYKFRSMVVNADALKETLMDQNEADEIVFKMRKDPRVTRVGRIIRKTSIDELPQLINVLQGDMSIVGPRPPVPVEVEQYQYQHFYRLDAIPGITGLQQVKGRSDITFKRWVQLDLEYIQDQSLWKDIQIILLTIPAVLKGKGAY
jgi:exopolysaccharide biosynthesis polyprenyl glycosylphosphotransferase